MRPLGDHVPSGTRVKVVRDPGWNGPWPTEPMGTIEELGAPDEDHDVLVSTIDLSAHPEIKVPDADRGPMREYFVRFDDPQMDGEDCGPYYAAVIWEKYLRRPD